jgi:hypothetical protein
MEHRGKPQVVVVNRHLHQQPAKRALLVKLRFFANRLANARADLDFSHESPTIANQLGQREDIYWEFFNRQFIRVCVAIRDWVLKWLKSRPDCTADSVASMKLRAGTKRKGGERQML